MQEPSLDELAMIAKAHLSMIRQIESGQYKGRKGEITERTTWLENQRPKLETGNDAQKAIAAEIAALTSQSAA
jgi:hypothetical protein